MTGTSLWFCSRCRCANAPARRICAACGAFAPDATEAPRAEPAPPVVQPVASAPPSPPAPAPVLAPLPEPEAVVVPRADDGALVDATGCPVCIGRLAPATPGERRCTACGGSWLDLLGIARLFAVPPRDLSPEERRALRARFVPRTQGSVSRARACLVCGEATERRPATSAGTVWGDSCAAHGVWLSAPDRDALAEFLAAGGASLPAEPVRKKPIHFVGSSSADGYGSQERMTRLPPKAVRPFGTSQPAASPTGEPLPQDLPRVCPTCAVPLAATAAEGVAALACASCRGRWVPAASFRALSRDVPRRALEPVERARLRAKATGEAPGHDPRPSLLCPECRRALDRRRMTPYAPVRVDLCRAHGVWFDPGELERWASFVREGGTTLPPPPHAAHPRSHPRAADAGLAEALIEMALGGLEFLP